MIPSDPAAQGILHQLHGTLRRAQDVGFLGPGPTDQHIIRALDLGRVVASSPVRALDLGTGGGIPGLPLALLWPDSEWVLLDGSVKRTAFLGEAVDQLGLLNRLSVVTQRAEVAARLPAFRCTFDLVVARGFAGPAVTAECGSPFLKQAGQLVVAEPPGGEPSRWDTVGLAKLGMTLGKSQDSPTACQVLLQSERCPSRFPRRTGIPAKRPLW